MFEQKIIDSMIEDARSLWPERWPVIEKHFQKCCLAASVDVVMRDLGLFAKKGDQETYDSMKEKIGGIYPDAEYVFQKLLDILVEDEVLTLENGTYTCKDPMPEVFSAAEHLVEAVREIPEEGAAFQWLARGAGGITQFIRGKITGEEVMFGPWADFSLVGDVYYTSEVYGFWSKLAGKVVKTVIETQFQDKKIEVLEIGAGTGNGTFELFKSLGNPADKFEKYIFTDIHRRLVKKTSKNFKEYHDFMDFRALDVTKPLEEQEIELENADILYAVNVMHATNDILSACNTMAKLTKKGGFAILGEIAPPAIDRLYRYMELTFGLLGSYFQYDDKDLRPKSPILRQEQWIEYFKKAGFSRAVAIPGDNIEGCDRGGVIIAQK